jgi:hypothetical protein
LCGRYHLKVVRLPISPSPHYFCINDFNHSFPIPDFKYFSFFFASILCRKN